MHNPIPSYEDWLLSHPALSGREEGDGLDDLGNDAGDAGITDTLDDESTDAGIGDEGDELDNGDGGGDGGDAPDEIDRVKEERDKARTELAAAQVAIQNAKREARKAREEAAKKGGNWEAVAKEREAELADINEKMQTAEARAISAEDSLDAFQREVRISRLATRLGFRDPGDAIKLLSSDVTGEDKVAERALRKLVEDKPYLVDQRRATGRAMGGNGNGAGLTREQVEKMSTDEINARWEEVQPFLTGGARRGG